MICEVHLDLSPASKPRLEPEYVTVVEEFSSSRPQDGWRVAWITTDMPRFLLGIERVQEMVAIGQNSTEYTTWETYFGILAPVARHFMGSRIENGFDAWMDGLKERTENLK